MSTHADWVSLDVAVIGGGIGGLAAATSLRRAGHKVTIYERADFAGEVGASISCAANGTRWLEEWNVDIALGRPVILEKLISHDWKTGEIINEYDLSDYKQKWGYVCFAIFSSFVLDLRIFINFMQVYNMFHRVNMHAMLMSSATGEVGEGVPAKLLVNHVCSNIDLESGLITFSNGKTARHDLIVGSDGIGSAVRSLIGILPDKKQSTSTCYHAIIPTEKVRRLGLHDFAVNNGIEYWGGLAVDGRTPINKIVLSPCREGELTSFYCFFPTNLSDHNQEGWNYEASVEQLLAPYPDLDPDLLAIFKESSDIRPWRLFVHQPYDHWQKGRCCIMGDAAHPMMPDQSQGACQAIEDAAALGLIFGKKYGFTSNVSKGLEMYESVRKPRATRVQAASARARENIAERIGFSSTVNNPVFKVADENSKLTIEEMNL